MVQASHSEMGGIGTRSVRFEGLLVDAIAIGGASESAAVTTAGHIPKRHVGVPHLLDQGVDSDASGITRGGSSRTTIRSGVQVEDGGDRRRATRCLACGVAHVQGKNPRAHVGRWHQPLDGYRVGPPEPLKIGKEISLPTQNAFWNEWAAASGTYAVVVITRQWCAARVVIPCVRVKIVVEIVFVRRAALGNNLHLRARRTIEVRGLVGGIHFELFDAVEWGRHHASGSATDRI